MNLSKLTIKARESLQKAMEIAEKNDNQEVNNEHLLSGLLNDRENLVYSILKSMEVGVTGS